MPLVAIINPVCGDSTAKKVFEDIIFPFLDKHGKPVVKTIVTEHAGHAGTALLEFLEATEGDTTVVLGSGDGTLHEIINILCAAELKGVRASAPPSHLRVALVPCGTANALYSSLFPQTVEEDQTVYKLKSLQAFIDGSETRPLTLAISTLSPPPFPKPAHAKVAISAVVTSTALHAAILHDSEALRKEIPGIERFKVAAQSNIRKWYDSYVKLLPVPAVGVVQIYDPAKKDFVDHEESHRDDPIVDVDGPFAYFLSTVNVDRLEPAFCITPLSSTAPPQSPSFDIVMIRPLEDPSLSMDSDEARLAFVEKAEAVLQGAYQKGSHIDFRYGKSGEVVKDGDGAVIVEYIRCGGWEWIPVETDEAAHLLCADGAIFNIEKGGRVRCIAAMPDHNAGFHIYV